MVLAALAAGMRRLSAQGGKNLPPDAPVEYIVVGSGAGGGPLACNLARAGHKVVLFDAGGDDYPTSASVPFFTSRSTEEPDMRWDYFVRHYGNTTQQARDSKFVPERDGVWYPRVGALGGCSIHSFLFCIYPSDADWTQIAELTADPSWAPSEMRKYFERLENCHYVPQLSTNPSRHGYAGWQTTEIANPRMFGLDYQIRRLVYATMQEVARGVGSVDRAFERYFTAKLDPNDAREQANRNNYYNLPFLTNFGFRRSPRDYILETAKALPNNLIIQKSSLVTRVLFNGTTATGVEYEEGKRLYRADPNFSTAPPTPRKTMTAAREVIVACGAFNSPQLLKLSGIGPRAELASHGITTIVDLPGVGENLQDRYEVGVVNDMKSNFQYYSRCTFFQTANDPCAGQLFGGTGGPYSTVGAYGAAIQTSPTVRAAGVNDPDLFIIGAAAKFRGYYLTDIAKGIGYSEQDVANSPNQHTWVILKAHTQNRGGTVKLRSANPRDTPLINFHYFEEGTDDKQQDLNSMIDAIEQVRRINGRVSDIIKGEQIPGTAVRTREQIADFVRNEAWGHHASCTNKMGQRSDPMAVVDSNFRVHGTRNLRIVDASVFPRIPGYFIITPIFMISEKAADVILADAR
jgi:choline dehydrogenase